MNILTSISSFIPVRPPSLPSTPGFNSLPLSSFGFGPKSQGCSSHSIKFPPTSPNPICTFGFPITATNQEAVSVVEFEEFVDKDWSFLEFDGTDSDAEHMHKIDRIISAGSIKETSKVLVSIGPEAFVDKIVFSSPCEQLFVVHDSLLVLACIKERHDKVKCWQGELIDLPEKWTAFDVLYLYFLPALSSELDQVLEALAKRCLPGNMIMIYLSEISLFHSFFILLLFIYWYLFLQF